MQSRAIRNRLLVTLFPIYMASITHLENITLRPVHSTDEELLRALCGSTWEEELATLPWPTEQKQAFVQMQWQEQKRHYAAEHPRASHAIICFGGIPVGRLSLDRTADAFHIVDVTLLPEHRNHGTGSYLLGQIMAEAKEAGKPVTAIVESYSPSLRLFQRLGFIAAEQKGPHLLMKWPMGTALRRRVS